MKTLTIFAAILISFNSFSFELPCHLKLAREILTENEMVQGAVINIIDEAERLESQGKLDEAEKVLSKSKRINYKIHELSNEVCSSLNS